MIRRSHFAPSRPAVLIEPAADLAGVLRQVERLSPEPRRPDLFHEQKQAIIRDLRRFVAAQRHGGSRR